jgi:hypothetical protein
MSAALSVMDHALGDTRTIVPRLSWVASAPRYRLITAWVLVTSSGCFTSKAAMPTRSSIAATMMAIHFLSSMGANAGREVSFPNGFCSACPQQAD